MLVRLVFNRGLLRVSTQYLLVTGRQTLSSQSVKEKSNVRPPKPNTEQKQIQIADAFGEKPYASMSAGEKVVEGTKDSFYMFVILGGIALTGYVGYIVFRELFSRETPNGIYSEALKLCKDNEEVKRVIGTPILGFGEETRRGRRRHISHDEFLIDGVKCMRMQFHVKGPIAEGIANLEVRKNSSNKYEYRYLFVDSPHSRKPIVLIDKR